MADSNRFKSMIQTARASQEGREPPSEPAAAEAIARPQRHTAPKGTRGRPATGKRSDPDFESTTVFLRRATKTAAAKLLLDDRGQDLSDVLEKLLSGWVERKTKSVNP